MKLHSTIAQDKACLLSSHKTQPIDYLCLDPSCHGRVRLERLEKKLQESIAKDPESKLMELAKQRKWQSTIRWKESGKRF